MDKSLDFIGIGNIAYDMVLKMDRFPSSDGKYPVQSAQRFPGGMIANATCAAAQLGLQCGYIGWIGDDSGGHLLRSDFEKHGVKTDGLSIVDGQETAFTLIIVNEKGERIILLPPSDLYHQSISDKQWEMLANAKIIYSHPRDETWYAQLINKALHNDQLLAMDIEWMPAISHKRLFEFFAQTDFVFVTQTFMDDANIQSIEDIPAKKWAVLTQGKQGSTALNHDNQQIVSESARNVSVVDTTGAGDCFHAAILSAYLYGKSLQDALKFATVTASITVQFAGARGGLPTRDTVEKVLNAYD